MLPGLNALEIGRLRMSVGYGTHKAGRPLSPVEVGNLLQRALDSGASLEDCAKVLKFKGTSQLSRFLSVRGLPSDILHLVDWGRSDSSAIGFTTAVELARVPDVEEKHAIAKAILEHGLKTDETRQAAQIRRRSDRPIEDCLKEVIGMRPTVERRYVFMGAIDDENVRAAVSRMTQAERNALLHAGLKTLGLDSVSGRLGEQLFTVVGDERLNRRLNCEGRNVIEVRLRAYIAENVANV